MVLVHAVGSEPVSAGIPCYTGKMQVNFPNIYQLSRNYFAKSPAQCRFSDEFPMSFNREFDLDSREEKYRNRVYDSRSPKAALK